jgi:hypothetical protein
VLLEPDGLEFFQLVRLTITPSTPIAIENEYMFEAEDDGTDVRPAIVDPAAPGVVMLLEHFTVGGVASMTPDQQAASKAKSAENADRRISDAVRERLADDRERQKQGGEKQLVDVTDLLEEYKREVLDKLKEAAALSCDFLYQYIKKLISFERQVQLLGVDTDRSYAAMVDEVFRILEQRYPQCEQEAIKKCRDAKDPQILIAFWLKNREVGYQTNVPVPEAMKAKAQQLCKPDGFQFHFAGTGDYGYDAPIKFEYWGLLCPEDEVWQIWEMVDHELGTESTGTPAEAMHGPILATFDDSGLMSSATYGPFGALPPGYLVHRTSLSLAPPGAPTSVTAKISAGQIDVVVTEPVVPWDGSFGKCEKV